MCSRWNKIISSNFCAQAKQGNICMQMFVCTYLKYLHVYYFRFLLAAASHNGSYLSSSSDSLLSRSLAVRDDFYCLKSHKVCQTAEETRYEGERWRIASKASIKPGQWLSPTLSGLHSLNTQCSGSPLYIKMDVGDWNHSWISYSALEKCDPRLAGRSEVMGPNCSQSHSQMLSNFQSD